MRVGVLTTSYPRDPEDPAGAFVAGFSSWLAEHVGPVEVLCAAPRRPLFYRGGAPLGLERPRGWAQAAGFCAALAGQAGRRARRWDVLVSHWLLPSALIGDALAQGRPHLAIAHGSDVALLRRLPGGAALERHLARRADLVYVAEALRAGRPGRVRSMGVDCARWAGGARERTRRALGVGGFVVLFLGRLVPDKGAADAVAALSPGMTLLVAGEGPERSQLERLAPPAGSQLRLLGAVHGEAKRDLLAAAEVLVIPSRRDAAPTVLLEARAAGLPVVASRVGGLPELLAAGDTGLLVEAVQSGRSGTLRPEPDDLSLRAALARLRDDAPLRAKLAAGARAAAPSGDWSTVAPGLWGDLPYSMGKKKDHKISVVRV